GAARPGARAVGPDDRDIVPIGVEAPSTPLDREEARLTMRISKPIAALAAGSLMLLGAAALAQNGRSAAPPGTSAAHVLVLQEEANLNWIEKSAVAALREGVIERMELQIGMPVKKDGTIGILHRKFADLTVRKAQLQADSVAPRQKAEAQEEVAASVCAR